MKCAVGRGSAERDTHADMGSMGGGRDRRKRRKRRKTKLKTHVGEM